KNNPFRRERRDRRLADSTHDGPEKMGFRSMFPVFTQHQRLQMESQARLPILLLLTAKNGGITPAPPHPKYRPPLARPAGAPVLRCQTPRGQHQIPAAVPSTTMAASRATVMHALGG